MNDEKAVELILQSLEEPLDAVREAELTEYQECSEQTRLFAELVQRIESTVTEWKSVPQSGESGPGMSGIVKARLRRQLDKALVSPLSPGLPESDIPGAFDAAQPSRRVAESGSDYTPENPGSGSSEPGSSEPGSSEPGSSEPGGSDSLDDIP